MVLAVSAFTDWFNAALEERGMKVRQFAIYAHVSHTAVLNWTRGAQPSPENCDAIAKVLKVSPSRVRELAGYGTGEQSIVALSPDEDFLLTAWRMAAPDAQRVLRVTAELIVGNQMPPAEADGAAL